MKSAANWENVFRSSLRAVQFASVSFCLRRLLKHFSCRSFRMMRTKDDCLPWYFTDCAVSSGLVLLTQNHIVHLVNVFIRAGTSCLSLPWRLSTVPVSRNFLSSLLMLLVVHPLSENSVLNCLVLYPFNWYNFLLESYLRHWKQIFAVLNIENITIIGQYDRWDPI